MNRIAIPFVILLGSLVGACGSKKLCSDLKCTADQTCSDADAVPACAAKTCAQVSPTCTASQVCDTTTIKCRAKTCTDLACSATQACDADALACISVPTLGMQIDRMGRPGVNTALTNPFSVYNNETDDNVTKKNYNEDANPAGWAAKWTPYVKFHLGILDGLDRNCGNSFGANLSMAAGAPRYSVLAGVLAGDLLNLNTATGTCTQYLGAEIVALGISATPECGGRKLEYDVIDTTYSALAAGVLTGVTDSIGNDSTFGASFPYLAGPNN